MDETHPTEHGRGRSSPPEDGSLCRRGRDSLTPTSFLESSEDEQLSPSRRSRSPAYRSRLAKRAKAADDDVADDDDDVVVQPAREGRVGAALCRWWKRPKCHPIGDVHSLSEAGGSPPDDSRDVKSAHRRSLVAKDANWSQAQSDLLRLIPHDVVGHCLSFVPSSADRMALVRTCRQFNELADRDVMLRTVDLAGEPLSGRRCFLSDVDTRETAVRRLARFVAAGNPESIHMMGLIRCYCYEDVEGGVDLLRRSAKLGHVQSAYSLGIILRDCRREESNEMMDVAATAKFLPAMQERNASKEIRDVHGVLTAEELRKYLDPIGLGRLLSKHYVDSSHGRSVPSSHCWNPLCGKWAYKSIRSASDGEETEEESNDDRAGDRNDASGGRPSSSGEGEELRVSRMKMCSSCRRAKYCSKLCQVFDWRSGRHKSECHFL